MSIWSLTLERVDQIVETLKNKNRELEDLKASTAQKLWRKDLEEFKKIFDPGCGRMNSQPRSIAHNPKPETKDKVFQKPEVNTKPVTNGKTSQPKPFAKKDSTPTKSSETKKSAKKKEEPEDSLSSWSSEPEE